MLIFVDKEGKEAVIGLCDVALRTAGIQNLEGVTKIIQSVRLLNDDAPKPTPNSLNPVQVNSEPDNTVCFEPPCIE